MALNPLDALGFRLLDVHQGRHQRRPIHPQTLPGRMALIGILCARPPCGEGAQTVLAGRCSGSTLLQIELVDEAALGAAVGRVQTGQAFARCPPALDLQRDRDI